VDRRPGRADRRRSLDQPAHPPALIHDRHAIACAQVAVAFPLLALGGSSSRFSCTGRGNPRESHASCGRRPDQRRGDLAPLIDACCSLTCGEGDPRRRQIRASLVVTCGLRPAGV
jgi:hypothetical protein